MHEFNLSIAATSTLPCPLSAPLWTSARELSCPPPLPQRSTIPHSPSSLSALSLCPPWTGRHGGHHWWVKPSLAKPGCPVGLFGCGSALGDLLGLPHCPSTTPCRSLSRPHLLRLLCPGRADKEEGPRVRIRNNSGFQMRSQDLYE